MISFLHPVLDRDLAQLADNPTGEYLVATARALSDSIPKRRMASR